MEDECLCAQGSRRLSPTIDTQRRFLRNWGAWTRRYLDTFCSGRPGQRENKHLRRARLLEFARAGVRRGACRVHVIYEHQRFALKFLRPSCAKGIAEIFLSFLDAEESLARCIDDTAEIVLSFPAPREILARCTATRAKIP